LKHRLRLEAVTGLDYLALQQDFGAKTVADNLSTLLCEFDTPSEDERASRPNRLYALGTLQPILGGCLLRIEQCLDRLADVLDVIPPDPMPHPAFARLLTTTQKSQAPSSSRLQARLTQWGLS
ncbi:hypothetical protein PQQ96_15710, partial [Paraburkholderia sediminicola]